MEHIKFTFESTKQLLYSIDGALNGQIIFFNEHFSSHGKDILTRWIDQRYKITWWFLGATEWLLVSSTDCSKQSSWGIIVSQFWDGTVGLFRTVTRWQTANWDAWYLIPLYIWHFVLQNWFWHVLASQLHTIYWLWTIVRFEQRGHVCVIWAVTKSSHKRVRLRMVKIIGVEFLCKGILICTFCAECGSSHLLSGLKNPGLVRGISKVNPLK